MTPLQRLAALLEGLASESQLEWVRSLAAREDLKVDGFWEDLAGPELWGERDSVASLVIPDPARSREVGRALLLLAEDLSLRGLGSADSERCFERLRQSAASG
ncbi:MAG: hypothetical protein J4G09_00905 [Proteobacteria bacterium]|nr:hypothetical protein [Pseudomonadota bacterium]